jgi:diguanylate cyclase (GGDEF)-like protein
MEQQTNHDTLTGLFNRTAVEQHLAARIDDVATAALGGFALMLIDLDAPRPVADAVLKEAGQRMSLLLRETDYLARWDGAAFLVLIPQVSERETLETIAQKVIDSVGAPYALDGAAAQVSVRIGISVYPKDGADRNTLLNCTGYALDGAKRDAHNHVRFYARENNNAA